jgi:hypothetical protein
MNEQEIKKILKNALQEAEMRQGCTDYTPYVDALYTNLYTEWKEQVICPIAESCGCCNDNPEYSHNKPHAHRSQCDLELAFCPTCIPVPSTAKPQPVLDHNHPLAECPICCPAKPQEILSDKQIKESIGYPRFPLANKYITVEFNTFRKCCKAQAAFTHAKDAEMYEARIKDTLKRLAEVDEKLNHVELAIQQAKSEAYRDFEESVRLLRKNDTDTMFLTGYAQAISDVQLAINQLKSGTLEKK